MKQIKIYACTPVAFHYRQDFLIRDTGLFASQLREMGVESKNIMPLPWHDDDIRDDGNLIRTELKNLYSEKWWRSLKLDGLVLYSWGAPRYTGLIRAARRAGIRVHLHMDIGGLFLQKPEILSQRLKYEFMQPLFALHMKYASVVTMGQPMIEKLGELPFYSSVLKGKTLPMACPVAPRFVYDGRPKEDKLLCIGRWDDEWFKRTNFLKQTLEYFYATPRSTVTEIYGAVPDHLKAWHAALPEDVRSKISLKGYLQNHLLFDVYNSARAVICTSRSESSHIVSAEGLCCGCSVVAANRPTLVNHQWYATRESGTISKEDTPQSLAAAIAEEMQLWDEGKRNPAAIAAAWHPYFHVPQVVKKIFPILAESTEP